MKTIFYNQNKIHISENEIPGFKLFFHSPSSFQIETVVKMFLSNKQFECLLIGDRSAIIKEIKTHFKHIRAAGGVVLNNKRHILFIKRLGLWDLPKGKMEKGESKRSCAMREVEEECGIKGLKIIQKLNASYHVYLLNNTWVFKTSYWYLMEYKGNDPLIPQAEEHIEMAIWMNPNSFDPIKYETYPAIKKVLHQSLFLLE